jgi:hypothetical protein
MTVKLKWTKRKDEISESASSVTLCVHFLSSLRLILREISIKHNVFMLGTVFNGSLSAIIYQETDFESVFFR